MNENYVTKELLIADDDEDDRDLMKEVIRLYIPETKVCCLNNGKELMNYLHYWKAPDLLLLDLNMPYKGGIECLKEMRKEPELANMPVVVLTTSRSRLDADECYSNGASLFFTKPWDFESYTILIQMIMDIDWKNFKRPANMEHFRKIAEGGKPSRTWLEKFT